ncbi:MAG: hypothetical protein EPGJADBJ_02706 [Saprospiraceae bacterium]|nr:hypothetical protein [Saprospiraceae bacterium]
MTGEIGNFIILNQRAHRFAVVGGIGAHVDQHAVCAFAAVVEVVGAGRDVVNGIFSDRKVRYIITGRREPGADTDAAAVVGFRRRAGKRGIFAAADVADAVAQNDNIVHISRTAH